jgi:hypothetical protein
MNVVDQLVVTLGLDSSAFTKGSKETEAAFSKTKGAATKAGKDIEDSGKKSAGSIKKLRNQVIGLFAAFTAGRGIKEFVADITASNAATGRLSTVLDMSVDKLSSWQGIARATGGSAQGITGTIANLQNSLEQLSLNGESSALPYLRALNIGLQNSSGQFKTADDLLTELASNPALKTIYSADPARANAILRGLGIDQNTANVILQGKDALAALSAEQRRWGIVNKEQADAAADLQHHFAGLEQSSTTLGRIIMTAVTPFLDRLLDRMIAFNEWLQDHPNVLTAITVGITTLAVALSAAALGLGLAAMATGFAAIVAAMPYVWIVAALAMFAAAAHGAYTQGSGVAAAGRAGLIGVGPMNENGGFATYRDAAGKIYTPEEAAKMGADKPAVAAPGGAAPAPSDIAKVLESGAGYNVVQTAQGAIIRQTGTAGWRNNNPGNLDYTPFSQSHGAVGRAGRFAVFPSRAAGEAAQQALLFQSHGYAGLTVSQAIARYAPSNENDTASYQAAVLAAVGGRDVPLDQLSPDQRQSMMLAMRQREGSQQGQTQVVQAAPPSPSSGLASAIGNALIPSAAAAEIPVGAPVAAAASNVTNNAPSNSTSSTNNTTIGNVAVHTQATDSKGIASSISDALRLQNWAAQLNYGAM